MYYCGFSYENAYKLSIPKRIWFINRVAKEIKETKGQKENKDPMTSGQFRDMLPNKLKRI
jgi:hypothetical protein